MQIEPAAEAFAARYAAGEPQVVWTTLVADLETPVSAYLKIAGSRPAMSFLLESVEGGAVRGRYSIIGLEPDLVLRVTGDRAEINRRAQADRPLLRRLRMRRLRRCAAFSTRAVSRSRTACRQWPPVYSAISVTTWCG